MNEGVKTLLFVGAAVLVAVIAVASQPRPPAADPQAAGKLLNEIEDPLTANSLKIVKFDEGTSDLREFEVAQKEGQWVIESHQDYPADAEQQMAQAATSVMNLEILGIASTSAGSHVTYGVVEPDPEQIEVGSQGVGTLVTMKNQAGDDLVNMIIGKEVKDQENQRYVRHVGKDAVYIVKLDPTKLTTDFAVWIEKDLLKLNPFDIEGLQLNDYMVEPRFSNQGLGIYRDRRSEVSLEYDQQPAKWVLKKLVRFDPATDEPIETGLPEGEELNQTNLNELKSALDDLKIVDVERKPEVIRENFDAIVQSLAKLEAGEQPQRGDPGLLAWQNLLERGFIAQAGREGGLDFLSGEGEVIAQMNDGVEYVLRFGRIVVGPGDNEADPNDESSPEKDSGINRYVFVSARFNKDLLEKPDLEEVPDVKSPANDADAKEAGEDAAEADANAKETDEEDATPKVDAESDENSDDEAAQDEPKLSAEEIAKERERIEKANRRKLDQYEAKVEAGQKRVEELNERFGVWYYVISDSVYRKIHLSLDDILQKKEKTDDAEDAATTEEEAQGE